MLKVLFGTLGSKAETVRSSSGEAPRGCATEGLSLPLQGVKCEYCRADQIRPTQALSPSRWKPGQPTSRIPAGKSQTAYRLPAVQRLRRRRAWAPARSQLNSCNVVTVLKSCRNTRFADFRNLCGKATNVSFLQDTRPMHMPVLQRAAVNRKPQGATRKSPWELGPQRNTTSCEAHHSACGLNAALLDFIHRKARVLGLSRGD